ncbi:hypothetical protein N656DRAFT_778078 [Canariomyces notabilis]|uniref:protein-ribulosamine 3-kinase n=1 Tax=Canariomyces notabilis TaxID=2074819 RepID=A0AAN6TF69_9PEZI|nr:hypothetical protein N656DRAFT_778078 [Canariomyces arenarius]
MVYIDPEFVLPTIPENESGGGTEVDANVLAALPEGTVIKWVQPYGISFWALSKTVDAIMPDGREQRYFLKVYNAARAFEIARGEYESTKELVAAIPGGAPTPVGFGVYADDPTRAFFLAEFRDMKDVLPGDKELVSLVAKIHQKTSPNGKFGYHVTTFSGKHPTDTTWCDTWEEFFTRSMKDTMQAELATQGPHAELEELSEKILTKVIPRLIRPMETGGRKITPVLVHGDLWHGNISVDCETEEPVVYDPCCFYGHNEYDFSMWRADRYRTKDRHVSAYFDLPGMEPNEPSDEVWDRNALYAMRSDLAVSILWPANKNMRELALNEMRRLVAKYGEGYTDEEYIVVSEAPQEVLSGESSVGEDDKGHFNWKSGLMPVPTNA